MIEHFPENKVVPLLFKCDIKFISWVENWLWVSKLHFKCRFWFSFWERLLCWSILRKRRASSLFSILITLYWVYWGIGTVGIHWKYFNSQIMGCKKRLSFSFWREYILRNESRIYSWYLQIPDGHITTSTNICALIILCHYVLGSGFLN